MTNSLDANSDLPLVTEELSGCGGSPRGPEDFVVEEIPAYPPSGAGEHCMALVQKRELTTPEAVRRLCRAVGADPSQAGWAGLKDRNAVTRQWVSIQAVAPEALLAVQEPQLQVLSAERHRNKIKTGHLKGNRFQIVLRGAHPGGLAAARAALARLEELGLPNFYGSQRFGRDGDNGQVGLEIVAGVRRPPRDRHLRRLLLSAAQSLLFNDVLARRLRAGCWRQLLGGEVLQRTDSGGLFVSEDEQTDGVRLAAGEVVITGPICGPRTPWPRDGSAALELEQEVLAARGATPEQFGTLGRLARGGRRPLAVPVDDAAVEQLEPDALRVQVALPPGSYVTVLLREVSKA